MWFTDSYTTELRGDRWITRSRSAVEIAGTEQVDGRWETTGRMINAHKYRFVGASAEEAIRRYLAWGGYLTSCTEL